MFKWRLLHGKDVLRAGRIPQSALGISYYKPPTVWYMYTGSCRNFVLQQ